LPHTAQQATAARNIQMKYQKLNFEIISPQFEKRTHQQQEQQISDEISISFSSAHTNIAFAKSKNQMLVFDCFSLFLIAFFASEIFCCC
jgi:hypothetical protein